MAIVGFLIRRILTGIVVVWLVATEHVYNITNIGLNIHSDMLCDITKKQKRQDKN